MAKTPVARVRQRRGAMLIKNLGAGRRNRTDIFSLEGCCTTIVLYPHGDGLGGSASAADPIWGLVRRFESAWWGK